jgi:hypothetical protein
MVKMEQTDQKNTCSETTTNTNWIESYAFKKPISETITEKYDKDGKLVERVIERKFEQQRQNYIPYTPAPYTPAPYTPYITWTNGEDLWIR